MAERESLIIMSAKHILHEKAREAKGLLRLSLQLARLGRWHTVEAAVDCVHEIFMDHPAPHLFQTETVRQIHLENEVRLRALMEKLPVRGRYELRRIRNHQLPRSLRGLVQREIWARLSIFLDENDPAALPAEDNLLLHAAIPLESFQSGKQDSARHAQYPENFTDVALGCAWPKPDTSLLAAADSVWLDFNVSYWLGVKLPQSGAPALMSREELAGLLSWRQTAADIFGDGPITCDPNYGENVPAVLGKLLCLVNELEAAAAFEVGPSLEALYLERYDSHLEKARKLIRRIARCGDKNVAPPGSGLATSRIRLAGPGHASGRENIIRLDQAMRLLEPAAKSMIRAARKMIHTEIRFDDTLLPENNPPAIEAITLWTRDNGELAAHFCALPLITVKYAGAELLCSGDDWSETPEIGHMAYLTHVIAHDSNLTWNDAGMTAYATIRIDCSRQAYRNFWED